VADLGADGWAAEVPEPHGQPHQEIDQVGLMVNAGAKRQDDCVFLDENDGDGAQYGTADVQLSQTIDSTRNSRPKMVHTRRNRIGQKYLAPEPSLAAAMSSTGRAALMPGVRRS
jgi:hypothetical protein